MHIRSIEQLKFLQINNCDEIQGYYFSRPLPVEQFEQLILEMEAAGNKLWASL